jgi:predicted CXXCH cytochrome family protein
LSCHFPEADLTNVNWKMDWCVGCHRETGKQFKKHITGGEGDCNGCHKVNGDLTRSVSGQFSDMNPCFGCHQDKIGQYAQDFIHGPVAGGTCTICHNPHGSSFEMNLRSPVPFLCMFCHTALETVHARVQHKPFAEGQCTACHDAHATNNKWVLVKSTGEVCLSCHEGKLDYHKHRYEVKPKKKLETDLVLNDQGQLECLTCHNPHAGDAEHLLKTESDNPCGGCHPGHM